MYFNKPSYKKEKVNGFEEGYKFNHVKTIGLTLETNVGGWETIAANKHDRILIMNKGLGSAKVHGKTNYLEKDTVLDVPAGTQVELNPSQLEFYFVSSKDSEILLTTEQYNSGWKSLETMTNDRVFVIKDGLGFAKIGKKEYRLNAGDVLEIPTGTEVQLSGKLEYYCICGKTV